jgi:predicted RNase H-like HicB family nuclease
MVSGMAKRRRGHGPADALYNERVAMMIQVFGETLPMKVQTFTAVIHREDDLYVASCPELGTVSQGDTIENALANLKEATELYLEEFPLPNVGRPLLTTFEATYA